MELVIGLLAALVLFLILSNRSKQKQILSLRSEAIRNQNQRETEQSEATIRILQKEVENAEKARLEAAERYRNANSFPPNDPTRRGD